MFGHPGVWVFGIRGIWSDFFFVYACTWRVWLQLNSDAGSLDPDGSCVCVSECLACVCWRAGAYLPACGCLLYCWSACRPGYIPGWLGTLPAGDLLAACLSFAGGRLFVCRERMRQGMLRVLVLHRIRMLVVAGKCVAVAWCKSADCIAGRSGHVSDAGLAVCWLREHAF